MRDLLLSPPPLPLSSPLQFRRAFESTATPALDRRIHTGDEPHHIAAPALLHPAGPVTETWSVPGPLREQRRGAARFVSDGQWLMGTLCIDDKAWPGGIRAASRQVYDELFQLLRDEGFAHLLRLWNYVADINGCDAGDPLERYRQFNIGRQDAFLAARRSAFDGAPAACALGTRQGPLTVHFLAGREAPRAVENPRQVSAYRYPSQYGPRAPTFSRGALASIGGGREALFLSGTASIVGHQTLHAGDVARQTEETLANVAAVVDAANALSTIGPRAHRVDTLACTVYVRHARDLPVVREVLAQRLGAEAPALRNAIYLRADVCRADLLVEVEAHGIASAAEPSPS
jgi:enamine deaminase RidA (YjgF/YER057c/UK114 family)